MTTDETTQRKQQAAYRAVAFVKSGMVLGLGEGSTAIWALRRIGELLQAGELHDIVGIPVSQNIKYQARQAGIPLATLADYAEIDLTIDGADEVDPAFNLIKGGGGALLCEKIVAQASKREIIIVDDSKLSPRLGTNWAVPVEVVIFGWEAQRRYLEGLGATVKPRLKDGQMFITDEGHYILDCDFGPIEDVVVLGQKIKMRTGIVEHGLFIDLATDVIVAGVDGVRQLERA